MASTVVSKTTGRGSTPRSGATAARIEGITGHSRVSDLDVPPHIGVAQLAEHTTHNREVAGSIPAAGTKAPSSNGQDDRVSSCQCGFESRWRHQ